VISIEAVLTDDEFLNRAFKGNVDAINLGRNIISIGCTWDDLIDHDVQVTQERINRMMWAALVLIPTNAFYRSYMGLLQPLMQTAIINWHLSNQMEVKPGLSREIAHVNRYGGADILLFIAALIGGEEWAIEVGAELKLRMQRDTWKDYDAEMDRKHSGGLA
jgi:hypothetical protein